MNLNKPFNKQLSQGRINFDKNKSNQQMTLSKADVLKQVDQFIQQQNKNLHAEMEAAKTNDDVDKHEESLPRLPVEIRQETNPDLPNKSLSVILEPTYCPENYSDFEDRCESVEESFHIPSIQTDRPCSSSTISESNLIEQNNSETSGLKNNTTKHEVKAKEIDKQQILKKLESLELEQKAEDTPSKKLEKMNRTEETEDLYQLLYKQQNQLLALEKQVC